MGALAQALAAPVALVALPTTALLLLVGRGRRARLAAAVVAVPAVAWLVGPGELPDQVMRTAALLAAAVFGIVSTRSAVRFTHRALLALGGAAAGIAVGFLAFGWSWDRLHWWVSFRAGAALRLLLTASAPSGAGEAPGNLDRPDFKALLGGLVRTSADLYPAALALELLLGLAIAVAVAPRLAGVPVGRPLGRFAELRFSDHLGWLLVLADLVVPPGGDHCFHRRRDLSCALRVLPSLASSYGDPGTTAVLDKERARIAKDLPDDLGASMTQMTLLLELASQHDSEPQDMLAHVQDGLRASREAIKSLDAAVWAVNPANNTLPELVTYIGQFGMEFLRQANIRCVLDLPDHPPERPVSSELRHNLFLIVKEALNTIVRHAHAAKFACIFQLLRRLSTCVSKTMAVELMRSPRMVWRTVCGTCGSGLRN